MLCNVCNILCSGEENFQAHIASLKHKKKMREYEIKLEHENKIKDQDSECDSTTSNNASINQLTNADLLMPYGSFCVPKPYAECSLCSMNFSGIEPYQQHLLSKGHKKKSTLASVSSDNQTIPFYCKICDLACNGPAPLEQHLKGSSHFKKEQSQQAISTVQPTTENESHEINLSGEKNPFYCDVCDMTCTGRVPFLQHLSGSNHEKKQRRSSFKNSDSPIPFAPSLLVHASDKHVSSPNWYCDVCQVSCTGVEPYTYHLNGQSHTKNMEKTKQSNAIDTVDKRKTNDWNLLLNNSFMTSPVTPEELDIVVFKSTDTIVF